eukprot:c28324_g1_i1 orf=198-1196(+)
MGVEGELVELFEKARKAADMASKDGVDGGPDEIRCIEAIRAMRAFPVTTTLLISSKVGKQLRNLTKHSSSQIQIAATDLLDVWKKVVSAEAKNGCVPACDRGLPKPSAVVKVEKVKVEEDVEKITSVRRETQVKIESQRVQVMKPSPTSSCVKLSSIPKTNDATRDKIRELLVEALSKVSSEADGEDMIKVRSYDPIRVAVTVEMAMFKNLGLSKGVNKLKYRSIMFNMKDSNNPDLRRKVLLGEVGPERLVNMTAEEMASDERKVQNKMIKEKALFECERGQNRQASTNQFKCGKCGERECTYYQLQTRSADEPMTTFVTCVKCNNRWKFC